MTLETDLRAFLIAQPAVAALIADRVFPAPAPQDTAYPFVTWTLITGQEVSSLTGPSGLRYPAYQLDCWADERERGGSYLQAVAVAKAVRTALNGYSGMWDSGRVSAMFLDERDTRDDQEQHLVARSMDFRIWHEEA